MQSGSLFGKSFQEPFRGPFPGSLSGKPSQDCLLKLMDKSINSSLIRSRPANIKYKMADSSYMNADLTGILRVSILNVSGQPGCDDITNLEPEVTTADMGSQNLWGLHQLYSQFGFNIRMEHPGPNSFTGLWKDQDHGKPQLRIPMTREYSDDVTLGYDVVVPQLFDCTYR